jgi:uncharacterized protein YbjT (DUF2867 family)
VCVPTADRPTPGDPVLVTGATGTHGGAVAQALLAAGRRVRALTRNPQADRARELAALGAELVAGDLLDAESLFAAMTGTAAVYAVTTPFSHGPGGELEQGLQIIAAAARVEVQWWLPPTSMRTSVTRPRRSPAAS